MTDPAVISIIRIDDDQAQMFIPWDVIHNLEADVDGVTLQVTDAFLEHLSTTPVEDI